jgi:hypothetical protein
MKVEVIPDCFKLPIKQSIKKAAEIKYDIIYYIKIREGTI